MHDADDLKEEIYNLIADDRAGNYTRLFRILDEIEADRKRIGPDGNAYLIVDGKRYPAICAYGLQSFASVARKVAKTHDLKSLSRLL